MLKTVFRDTVVSARGMRGVRRGGGERGKERKREKMVQRFRQKAGFVVETIMAQFVFGGIARAWGRLMGYLDDVEGYLEAQQSSSDGGAPDDEAKSAKYQYTFAGVVKSHADMINSVAEALLLKQRQSKAAVALETVLSDVLEVARLIRDGDGYEDVQGCYNTFEGHVKAFVAACGNLLEKDMKHEIAASLGQRDAEECLQELVQRLEGSL